MVQDLLKSWFGDNKVKITSPVLGAFMGAWILFNWKHFLLLFWGGETLEIRLTAFEEVISWSNFSIWLWPFLVALFYAFGLPYLNVISHRLIKKAEELRYKEVIGIDVVKAKKKAELNEELYKADPSNPYLGRKINAELKKKEADADKSRAEADKAIALKHQAEASKEKVELEITQQKLLADEAQRKDERERLAHEMTKAKHHQQMIDARFPTLYLFLDKLSRSLIDDGLHISLGLMAEAISVSFGYNDVDSMLDDAAFTLPNLEKLSCVVYDDSVLMNELAAAIVKHQEAIGEDVLFSHLVDVFNLLDRFKYIPSDLMEDVVKDFIDDNSNVYDLVHHENVSASMAETNSHSFEVEYTDLICIEKTKDGIFIAEASTTIAGDIDTERPYSGHEISVVFKLLYEPVIGKYGYGAPEFQEVEASLHDYR